MKHLHPDWAVIEMKNEKSRKREQNQIPKGWNEKQSPFSPAAVCGFSTHAELDQNRRDQQEAVTRKPGPAQNQTPNVRLYTLKPSKKFAPELSIL